MTLSVGDSSAPHQHSAGSAGEGHDHRRLGRRWSAEARDFAARAAVIVREGGRSSTPRPRL